MADVEGQASSNGRVALFIDVDNVLILAQNSGLPFHLHLIIDRVRQHGTIMSSKAYADWTASLLRPVLGDFRANAIELVQLPTSSMSKEHKNTADIQLTVDALEMVFSPVRPNTIVIVGGDRDYVPLVQKLKRYGIYVMGIGVEAGVSSVLIEACDSFVFYDDIVPPAPEEIAGQVSAPNPDDAYTLMRRAVEALNREGRITTGASVHAMMKQLAPAFDLVRYRTTLKALAQGANAAGYVNLTDNPGYDFTLSAGSPTDSLPIPISESTKREYDYSTPVTMTASYRTILQERRIPLLPWRIREQFMKLIWRGFDEHGDYGMSFDSMRETLLNFANMNDMRVSQQMIQKLLYTLNFAYCFNYHQSQTDGYRIAIPEDVDIPIYPVVDVDGAIRKLHQRYIQMLADEAPQLDYEAVFDLLYGDEVTDEQERGERMREIVNMCDSTRPKPMGAFGQALLDANRPK